MAPPIQNVPNSILGFLADKLGQIADVSSQPFRGWLPRDWWPLAKDYFSYTFEWLTLAASATSQTVNVQLQADAHFVWLSTTGRVTASDNTTDVAAPHPFRLTVVSTGSGRQLMNTPVHYDNMAGTAQEPFQLPFPKMFLRASTISIAAENLSATARNIRLTLHGFKVWPQ